MVEPAGDSWLVLDSGVVSSEHQYKQAAVKKARRLAKRRGSLLKIKRSNGSVQRQVRMG